MKQTLLLQLAAPFAIALVATLTSTASANNCNCYVGDMPSDASGSSYVSDGGSIVVGDGSSNFVGDGSSNFVGDCQPRRYGNPDLFYNFFTEGACNQANAQLYLSPLPVPPNVGHTFYTYQPFYPHHMMYWHKDRFHNYYDNGRGMNRTRAVYYSPPIRQAASNFYWNMLRLPR